LGIKTELKQMNQDRSTTITNSQLKEGYKQTEVGVIPEDWKCVELDQLSPFITSGSRGWADFYSEYGNPFVRITNMFRESISLDLKDLRYVNLPIGANEGKRTQLYDGDLLISITADIGIIAYVDNRLQKPAYINQHIALVRFDQEKVNSQFVSYFLSHESSQKWFRGGTDQGAKAGMSLITVRKIKTAIPPLSEQEAIACTLSDIDALIESLDRLLTKKRQIKQGAMQELLRSTDGWIEYPFSEICWFQEGPGVRNHQFTSAGVKLFNGTNIEKGKIDLDKTNRYISEREAFGWYSHFLVDVGDIVIACSGISIDKFDEKVAVIDEQHLPLCMNTSTMRFKVKQEMLDKYYLLHFLRSSSFKSQIGGTATGSAQLNFGPSHVSVVKIQLPGLHKQIEIANILSDMDAEIGSISAKLTKTRQLKQGMMHELLTGRIRLVDK
jgi:type I restriction enzyme, S subunit